MIRPAGLIALFLAAAPAPAVELNHIFSDGVVLQRGMPAPIWGSAPDGEEIVVSIAGQTARTKAAGGAWRAEIGPLKEGGPYVLSVRGRNAIEVRDVLVGEVWLCAGQSNMGFTVAEMSGAQEAIARAKDGGLRLLNLPVAHSSSALAQMGASWQAASPETAPAFSAVAYVFGRELRRTLKVPVGIINASAGGSVVESWISGAELARHGELMGGLYDYHSPGVTRPYGVSGVYNAMIHPLISFRLAGMLWYQGNSNDWNAARYHHLLPLMIRSWRAEWNQTWPLLILQIEPIGKPKPGPQESKFAEVREAQLQAARFEPRAALVAIPDLGDPNDAHPKDKTSVARRAALAARGLVYGEKREWLGPTYDGYKIEGARVLARFQHAGGLSSKKGGLKGFMIAGADRKFRPARAEIRGNVVAIWSPEVPRPAAARYGWADRPAGNLVNGADLPASPFRTDDFPLLSDGD